MSRPPRIDTVRRRIALAGIIPLGVAGGLLGSVAIAPILRIRSIDAGTPVPAWELVAYAFVTAFMTMAALALALRSRKDVGRRGILTCTLFGWWNCPACLLVWCFVMELPRNGFAETLLFAGAVALLGGLLIGAFIALPIGLFYGLVAKIPMRMIGELRAHPTLDAVPRATRIVTLTVIPSALFGALVAYASVHPSHASVPPWLLLVMAGVAVIGLVWADRKLRRHRAWLKRVASNVEPRWALVPTTGAALPALLSLPPGDEHPGSMLVYTPDSSPTYRTTEERVFWAASVTKGGNDPSDGGV